MIKDNDAELVKPLVILSVPFVRNIKYLLLSNLYTYLSQQYQLIIISPFSCEAGFKREFSRENVNFLSFDLNYLDRRASIFQKLYGFTEFLRLNGYHFVFRNKGLGYYWEDYLNKKKKGKNFLSSSLSWFSRIFLKSMVLLAYMPSIWRIFDSLLGVFFYPKPDPLLKRRKSVLLIEVANFGYQARCLAYYARKFSFKSVLLPYAQDQATVNGFLINPYNVIFSQGEKDEFYLKHYYNLQKDRVVALGSLWFYNLMVFSRSCSEVAKSKKPRKVILYAGNSSSYFPKASEFEAIDSILYSIKNDKSFPDSILIYRPIVQNENEHKEIESRYNSEEFLVLQFPECSAKGMVNYSISTSAFEEMSKYVDNLSQVDLFISSIFTSMALDALALGVPVISNNTDTTGRLTKAGYFDFVDLDIFGFKSCGIPFVYNLEELLREIISCLSGDIYPLKEICSKLFCDWHKESPNYSTKFKQTLSDLLLEDKYA